MSGLVQIQPLVLHLGKPKFSSHFSRDGETQHRQSPLCSSDNSRHLNGDWLIPRVYILEKEVTLNYRESGETRNLSDILSRLLAWEKPEKSQVIPDPFWSWSLTCRIGDSKSTWRWLERRGTSWQTVSKLVPAPCHSISVAH